MQPFPQLDADPSSWPNEVGPIAVGTVPPAQASEARLAVDEALEHTALKSLFRVFAQVVQIATTASLGNYTAPGCTKPLGANQAGSRYGPPNQ